jgi:hypothetical protein
MSAGIIWRRSTRSADHGGNCVEVGARAPHNVVVRDTKHHDSGILTADHTEWTGFLAAIQRGQFDC